MQWMMTNVRVDKGPFYISKTFYLWIKLTTRISSQTKKKKQTKKPNLILRVKCHYICLFKLYMYNLAFLIWFVWIKTYLSKLGTLRHQNCSVWVNAKVTSICVKTAGNKLNVFVTGCLNWFTKYFLFSHLILFCLH